MLQDLSFFSEKRIFLTGHTGFKGSWLCRVLTNAGAALTGYALDPPAAPNLFSVCGVENRMTSIIGDVRDLDCLMKAFVDAKPEIVIHMAAQPLVRESYISPVHTYETNVMGTVNILECIRKCGSVRSFLNVTTDKVYHNNEWEWGYRETDPLDGFDPYSNSKSCSELVTHCYKNSFFSDGACAISTARAGNVIGGGDFSKDRIIPDCAAAAEKSAAIIIRNPVSIRPYQHVLESLSAYLAIVQKQSENGKYAGYYNVGPDDSDCITTGQLADLFCEAYGNGLRWESHADREFHEANFLSLDCSRIKSALGWAPRWDIKMAVEKAVQWYKAYHLKEDIVRVMDEQIGEYFNGGHSVD